MTRLEDETKTRIAAFLPEAIATALRSYARFAGHDAPTEEARDFTAHHNACKVAIAHIELLVKLARWVDLPDAARAAEAARMAMDAEILMAAAEAGEIPENSC